MRQFARLAIPRLSHHIARRRNRKADVSPSQRGDAEGPAAARRSARLAAALPQWDCEKNA